MKEATARIKINKLLEAAGWRLLSDGAAKANVVLEPNIVLEADDQDFESVAKGYVDFLLLDDHSKPLAVLEAKAESKNPLVGKEQARKYAKSLHCRFIILSNGNLHYFWDLEQGNPQVITQFPSPGSMASHGQYQPDPDTLIRESVGRDYIVQTQLPGYDKAAGWQNLAERDAYIIKNKLRFLRDYQKAALNAIQDAVANGQNRFLFEMATGTGKTLTSAAVIKLFLRTGNARRVLFLVDRLELEDQAAKAFKEYLKNDYQCVIYKERRDDWRKAEIVVTTVQSLLFNNKYQQLFSPTDFDLVISDEAHRSIGGNARAVFEYFVGYKLGLTATPKDYLKGASDSHTGDPRDQERRLLLDTYRTFGCETGQPTYRYSLLDGVKQGFLINPVVVDARTDITTQLLSEQGYAVTISTDEGDQQQSFESRDFEKKFYSDATNRVFCETFIKNSLLDPISGELGKGIVFAVSQNHAAKLTQLLNDIAHQRWPGKYQSDFSVQVTSSVTDAQQFTLNFTNNKLMGSANFIEWYKTSKARLCVTVGMMTTGYDCPDILNLALMRPVFSPSEFVQIKGRGTRKHSFLEELHNDTMKADIGKADKQQFKFFDFFANCEYFEEEFDYDEVLKLPPRGTGGDYPPPVDGPIKAVTYEHTGSDMLAKVAEQQIGVQGMKIDRMFFEKFEDQAKADATLQQQVDSAQWEQAAERLESEFFNKPADYFNLDKLARAAGVDRRLTVKEVLEKVFGLIPKLKNKDELLEDEFATFLLANQGQLDAQQGAAVPAMKYFFKAYASDEQLRAIIDEKKYTELNVNPGFGVTDLKAVPPEWRERIPEYVKDYLPLKRLM